MVSQSRTVDSSVFLGTSFRDTYRHNSTRTRRLSSLSSLQLHPVLALSSPPSRTSARCSTCVSEIRPAPATPSPPASYTHMRRGLCPPSLQLACTWRHSVCAPSISHKGPLCLFARILRSSAAGRGTTWRTWPPSPMPGPHGSSTTKAAAARGVRGRRIKKQDTQSACAPLSRQQTCHSRAEQARLLQKELSLRRLRPRWCALKRVTIGAATIAVSGCIRHPQVPPANSLSPLLDRNDAAAAADDDDGLQECQQPYAGLQHDSRC